MVWGIVAVAVADSNLNEDIWLTRQLAKASKGLSHREDDRTHQDME